MTLRMSQSFPRYCAFVSLPPLLAWPLTCSWLLPSCFLFSMIKKPGQQLRRDRSLRMPKADNQRAPSTSPPITQRCYSMPAERIQMRGYFSRSRFWMLCNSVQTPYTSFLTCAMCQYRTILTRAMCRWKAKSILQRDGTMPFYYYGYSKMAHVLEYMPFCLIEFSDDQSFS